LAAKDNPLDDGDDDEDEDETISLTMEEATNLAD
jgi:hypothetical protein